MNVSREEEKKYRACINLLHLLYRLNVKTKVPWNLRESIITLIRRVKVRGKTPRFDYIMRRKVKHAVEKRYKD